MNNVTKRAPFEMTQEEYHIWRSSIGHSNRATNINLHRSLLEGYIAGRRGTLQDDGTRKVTIPAHILAEYHATAAQ